MNLIKKAAHLLYTWWMSLGRFLGAVNAAILLTVFYILIIGAMSLIVRILRKDLLAHRTDPSRSFWKEKEPVIHGADQARHQF